MTSARGRLEASTSHLTVSTVKPSAEGQGDQKRLYVHRCQAVARQPFAYQQAMYVLADGLDIRGVRRAGLGLVVEGIYQSAGGVGVVGARPVRK